MADEASGFSHVRMKICCQQELSQFYTTKNLNRFKAAWSSSFAVHFSGYDLR
jgi:hypothetical protein